MAKRKQIDWEKGEKLYRLGQLSAAEIGRQLGCPTSTVTRHMKSRHVLQDKSDEVRLRTKAALATQRNDNETQRNATPVAEITEEDIVQAVDANVALVLSHRKSIQKLSKIEQKFLDELGGEEEPTKLYITQYQGDVIKEVLNLTISEKSATLLALANVQSRRVTMERQAFNIADETEGDKTTIGLILSDLDVGGLPKK